MVPSTLDPAHPDAAPAIRLPDTSLDALDADLAVLEAHKTEWARLPVPVRRDLLRGLRERTLERAGRWVTAASRAKGLAVDTPLRGEEWSSGPWSVLNYLSLLDRTLAHIEAGTLDRLVAGRIRQRPDGQTIVRVVPDGVYDQIFFSGYQMDIWMQPGVTPDTLVDTMAVAYRDPDPAGAVSAVLGAGNLTAIPPLDLLYKLYAENQVAVLKLNPVNSYVGPILEDIFADFVERGYVRFVYGGADVGEALTRHDAVDEIHVTGSATTHDAIVFGTGADGARRKAADEPAIDKRVTSELGGVGPVVVVPGDWSEPDLRFHAENVASMKLHNSGFNCVAAQVLVLPEAWPQREAFLAELRAVLAEIDGRPAYYPGADARRTDVEEAYPQAESIGPGWTLVPDVPPDAGEYALTTEFFGPILAVTALPGGGPDEDPADWLDRAVTFCNESVAGTLGVNLLVHPRTRAALGSRLEDAISRLRYGTVAINVWTGGAFLLGQAAWGAFPGHERTDIQSGSGVVHNALLFDRPQKSVLSGPFAPFPRSLLLGERHTSPTPLWFVTNETAGVTAQRLTAFAAAPSPLALPGILASALRG